MYSLAAGTFTSGCHILWRRDDVRQLWTPLSGDSLIKLRDLAKLKADHGPATRLEALFVCTTYLIMTWESTGIERKLACSC